MKLMISNMNLVIKLEKENLETLVHYVRVALLENIISIINLMMKLIDCNSRIDSW